MYNKMNKKGGVNMKNNLKETREKAYMSQEELAREAEVSRTIISELENGKTEVTTNKTLEKIANALNKKVPDIFFID